VKEIAREIAATEARHRVLVRAPREVRSAALRALVSSALEVQAPAILAAFHVGAIHTIGPALERLGKPVLAFRTGLFFEPRPPLEIATVEGTTEQRAATFHRALHVLRSGGYVVVAPDIAGDIETRCLGRPLPLARGAFALARLTRVPIVPIVATWTRYGVSFAASEPLPTSDSEEALASSAAAWLEAFLLANPSQISLGLLRTLLNPASMDRSTS